MIRIYLAIIGCLILMASIADTFAQGDDEPRIAIDRLGVEMVLVPEGDFELGVETEDLIPVCEAYGEWSGINVDKCIRDLDDDLMFPAQQVHMESFWMDRFEMTNEI